MYTKTIVKLSALASVVAVMTGCASLGKKDFSCSAPDGFVCKSPSEIYELTHGNTDSVYQNTNHTQGGNGDDMFKSGKGATSKGGDANLAAIKANNQFSKPAYTPNSNP